MNYSRPMTLMEVISDTVSHCPDGTRGIAEELDKAESTLYSELNPNVVNGDGKRSHKLGFLDWVKILRKTGDHRSFYKLGESLNIISIPMSDFIPNQDDKKNWLNHIAEISKETGEAVTELADSASRNNLLNTTQRKKVKKETYEAIQALASLYKSL
ncbi:MAG: hypothetical protein GY874_21885 [Desulfobacteraceae bacterium]|nr:hypothetical protein [Desulfobacteraceae bacterium]